MSEVFPSVLYELYDQRYKKITDQNAKDQLQDADLDTHKVNLDAHPVQNVMEPATNNAGRVGGASKNYAAGYFQQVFLGGVGKTAWDLAASGLNGLVMSGVSTFGGVDGITITHNLGLTGYVITATPLAKAERVGGVWYVRAANTVTVYNTGEAGIQFTITIEVDAGMTTPAQWLWRHYGGLQVDGQIWAKNLIESLDIKPDSDAARTLGSAILRYLQGHFVNLTLGGVSRSEWPTAVAGSNGNVFISGGSILNGRDGVTITHNKGDLNYLIKAVPVGLDGLGRIGEISYVKSSNTAVIYNSGEPRFTVSVECSNMV